MWNDARFLNVIANALAVLAAFVLLVAGVLWLVQRPVFALTAIELESASQEEPLSYVTPEGVRSAIAGRLHGNFFTLDLDEARQVLESAPWVRRASVQRVWPNTIKVSIEEQQPLAFWNENQMINTWGEVFTANLGELADDEELPRLLGPEGAESLVVQRYAELARWFAPLTLQVRRIELSPRYAWMVDLSDGMTLNLGRDPGADAPDPHGLPGALPFAARIQQFVQVWPDVVRRLEGRTVKEADLRYPNGFALTLAELPNNSLRKKH